MAQGPETKLVNKILKTLNNMPNVRAEKLHGSAYGSQKLDLFGAKDGKLFYLEVKVPGNKPTKRQESTIRKWQEVGVLCTWVDSVDQTLELVKAL